LFECDEMFLLSAFIILRYNSGALDVT